MRQSRDSDAGGYDWTTILLWAALVLCGWGMIFARRVSGRRLLCQFL